MAYSGLARWDYASEQRAKLCELMPRCERGEISLEEVAQRVSEVPPGHYRSTGSCRLRWERYERPGASRDGRRTQIKAVYPYGDEPEAVDPAVPIDPVVQLMDSVGYDVSLEECFDLLEHIQAFLDKIDPIEASYTRTIETDKPIALLLTSDWHLMSRWVAYEEFRDLFDWASMVPRLYWAVQGDEIDGFDTNFYHARPVLDQLLKPPVQRRVLAAILSEIEERILYSCLSTSAHTTDKLIGECPVRQWYVQRKIPAFVGQGILSLKVGTKERGYQEYILAVAHAFPGSSIYNVNHPQARALLWICPQADVIASGHRHTFGVQQVNHHELAHQAIPHLQPVSSTYLVQIGTASTGPDPYSISRWQQGVFNWPVFVFFPDHHEVIRVERKSDILYYLGED